MGRSVLAAALVLTALLVVQLPAGNSQCFSNTDCTGTVIPAGSASAKDCCVGTDDGMSYATPGNCLVCIVHGFERAEYNGDEGMSLSVVFKTNVKGPSSTFRPFLPGVVTTMELTARVDDGDFEATTVSTNLANRRDVMINVFLTNNDVTLEYNDQFALVYNPRDPNIIPVIEIAGQFVRDNVTVTKVDNDQLQINFKVLQVSVQENLGLQNGIELQFRKTQNPFTLTLRPVTLAQYREEFNNITSFIDYTTIPDNQTADAMSDFSTTSTTITIPATTSITEETAVVILNNTILSITNDEINEIEQSFALIAEIGIDVPDSFVCFQIAEGDRECVLDGRKGAVRIRIVNDDDMTIGFTSDFKRVSEAEGVGLDDFSVEVEIKSPIKSEISYDVPVRVQEMRNATIIPDSERGPLVNYDASFGMRQRMLIQQENVLVSGQTIITLLPTINSDFNPEDNNECFTLQIDKPDVGGVRAIFECDVEVDGTQYYCSHTICIDDDDDPFLVRFVETAYTITEGEGDVEVCVNLTRPTTDILDNFVGVDVYRDDTSLYVPSDVMLATPDRQRLGVYPMEELTDYQEQGMGQSTIINEEITELMRVVCYDQVIYDDLRLESDEFLGLTLEVQQVPDFTSVRTDIEPFYGDAVIQIIDDDVARVGIDPTFIQVNETVGFVEICAVVFEPAITCPIEFDFSISLSTCDGSAETPTDYEEVDTILLFRSCQIRACINVGIVDDNVAELTERFSVKLNRTVSLDTRITLDPVEAEIEIIDNDVDIGFERTVYTVTETEGSVEVCGMIYSFNLSRNVTVRVESSDGTAVETVNYQRIDMPLGPFTQPAQKICFNVSIMNNNDCNDDPNLNFTIEMSRQDPFDIGVNIVIPVTTIVIDDSMEPECNPIVVGYEMTTYTTTEGMGYVELCAVITSPSVGVVSPRPFVISATTVDDTAVAPDDYDEVVGFELVFNIGDNRVCQNVTINDDELCEQPAESFLSRLSYVSGQMPITIDPEEARVFIDDDNEPECEIIVGYEFTSYTTTEAMGSVTLCAIIYNPPSGVAPRPFTISATTQDGTAISPDDYLGVTGVELVFNTGDMRQCYDVIIEDDQLCEMPAENFFSDLSYVSGQQVVTINPVRTTVFIDDSGADECDSITVGYERTTYTTTEGMGYVELCAVITIPLSGIAPRSFVISASTEDDTAIAPDDYDAVVGFQLSFAVGDARVCHNVTINDDNECEQPAESFLSRLSYVSGEMPIIINPEEARVFIDDDNEPECAIVVGYEMTTYTTTEGMGYVELCAVITSPSVGVVSPRPFIISATTVDDTAVAPDDYDEVVGFQLAFDIGDNRVCHNVTINDDNECEQPAESFLSRLSYVSGEMPITIAPEEARVFIDDDNEPECEIIVGYEFTSYTTTEAMGSVTLCAIIYNPPSGVAPRPFTISATTQDGTAISPGDYGAVVGEQLVFNTGDRRRCHTVNIVDDDDCEQPAEDFFSNLMFVSGQPLVTINPAQAQVIIDDDNEPECEIIVGYEFTSYTTTEAMGSVTLCAIIYNPPSGVAPRPFTISATTQDGTAIAPGDYGAVVGEQLVFNTGDRRRCHTVNIVDDDDCEQPAEDFFSNLMFVSGQQVVTINPVQAQVFIDDDNEPECEIIVGYEFTSYTTTESMGSVTLCAIIYNPPSGVAPRPFTISATTQDGTAIAPGDYGAVVGEQLVFNTGDDRQCHTVNIVDDDICEEPLTEHFLSDLAFVSGQQVITIDPAQARVVIVEDGDDCVIPPVLVNDTLTGDPLMTVPILTDEDVSPGDEITSLCYEVHGQADYVFNLVSDTCVAVNAHYAKAPINSPNIDLNVVDAIGVRAVSNNDTCVNISVGLQGCQATVNGVDINGMYRRDGISVREYANRVRIVVPNCEDTDLVMWVFCRNGQTEDPVTWEIFNFNFIRYVVRRGLNLAEESHGLIGQFWNVPVELTKYTGDFDGAQRDDAYTITVKYPGIDARSFVGLLWSVTWEFERRPCLYVGNSQAGPLGEEDVDPNDSVIEGSYRDYRVDSMFSSDFTFSHFDETLCP